jgi:hypothetical protein
MAGIYRQRHPAHTVFYRVFFDYFEQFLREYEDRFEKEYGYFRPVIQDVVEKFEAERPPPPRHVQQDLLMAAEESGERAASI